MPRDCFRYVVIPTHRPQDATLEHFTQVLDRIDTVTSATVLTAHWPTPLWLVGLVNGVDNRTIQVHDSEDSAKVYAAALCSFHGTANVFTVEFNTTSEPVDAT